ncbi:MAG: hypothetical protein LBK54_05050, partial [Propionibacteriaceae bacterium]|nr:hypothetical protein [Propionibacteriaceae bacterium]
MASALALAWGGLSQSQAWADDPPEPPPSPTVVAPDLTTKAQPFLDEAAGITLAATTPVGTLWTVEYPGGTMTMAANGETADAFRWTITIADGWVARNWNGYSTAAGDSLAVSGGLSMDAEGVVHSAYTIPATRPDGLWFKAGFFTFGPAAGDEGPLLPAAGAAAGDLTVARLATSPYTLALSAPAAAEGYLFGGFEYKNLTTGAWVSAGSGTLDPAVGRWSSTSNGVVADSLWRAVYRSFAVADPSIQPAGAASGQVTVQASADYSQRVRLTAPAPEDGFRFVQFEQSVDGQTWSPLPCLTASSSQACLLTARSDGSFGLDNVPLAQSLVFRALYFGSADGVGIYPAEAAAGSLAVQSSPGYPNRLMLTAPAPAPGWFFYGFEFESAPGTWTAVTSNGLAVQQPDGTLVAAQVTPAASASYRARYFQLSLAADVSGAVTLAQGPYAAYARVQVALSQGRTVGLLTYAYDDPNTGQPVVQSVSRSGTAVADQPGVYQILASWLPAADLTFSASLVEFGLDPVPVLPAAAASDPVVSLSPANPFQMALAVTVDPTQDYVFDGWYCSVLDGVTWSPCASGRMSQRTPASATVSLSNQSDWGKDVRFQARFFAFSAAPPVGGGTFTVQRSSDTGVALAVTSTVEDATGTWAFDRWEQSLNGGAWTQLSTNISYTASSLTGDTAFRAVFTELVAPAQLTLVQDTSKGLIAVQRNGANQAILSVVSTVSDADGVYGFVRWQYSQVANPGEDDWSDFPAWGGFDPVAEPHSYNGVDTSYRAVFARVAVEVAADSVGLGQVAATVDPAYSGLAVIQASPTAGYEFDHWKVSSDGGQTWAVARASQNLPDYGWQNDWLVPAEYELYTAAGAAEDVIYRAYFVEAPAPSLLTVQPVEGGTVELTQLNREAAVLRATADPGYVHVGWQSKVVDALVWQQADWFHLPDYAILVRVSGDEPVVYRARFARVDDIALTVKTAPEAKGGLSFNADYSAQIAYAGQAFGTTLLSGWTTRDGSQPSTADRFLDGNLADQATTLPSSVVFGLQMTANATAPTQLATYFDAENYAFVGFRINGELVEVADFEAERGANSYLLGSLASGRLTYMLSSYNGWTIELTNSDVTTYPLWATAIQLPAAPAGTAVTSFAGDLVVEPVYAHKGTADQVAESDLADVGSARAVIEAVAEWVVPQDRALSESELLDRLITEVGRSQLSGAAAEIVVTGYTPAVWGVAGGDGVDGDFSFNVTLTRGEATYTVSGLSGRIAWAPQPVVDSVYRLNVVANDPTRGVVGAAAAGGTRWRVTAEPGEGWILSGWEVTPSAEPAGDAEWTPLPNSLDLRLQTVELDFDITYRAVFVPGLVELVGAEARVVRAVDGVSVSGGPFVVGGGAGTSCADANANYLSGHALPMITIESHYYRPGVSQLTGCAAGLDTVSAFDNVVLWFPVSQLVGVAGAVSVEVFGGPGLDQPLGSVQWVDLTSATGVVIVPVDSLPPGDQVRVSLTVAGQPAVEKVYDLSNPPSTDKGLTQERAAAVAQLRQLYLEGLARNAVGTSATGQYYSSRYLMLTEEYPHAVTAIAETEGAEALAEAVAYWTRVLEDAGNNVFSTGVTLNAAGSIVTVPESANILMAMTAAAEQANPGLWRLSTGYGGAWINGWRTGGWGQITDDGQAGGAMYVVYDQACVEASTGNGPSGHFGNACPYTNGVAAQRVYLTAEPSDGLYSTFGQGDGVVTFQWNDPDPDAAWPGAIYAWPGTMGWALGDLRQAFDDADLQTHEAYTYAIAHQSPLAEEYELAFNDLKVEFLDFLFRKDASMTEAAKAVVRAIAALGTQSTQADREVILAAYGALTAPEKQVVFNYEELDSWPPRGTGFVEATVAVTGAAADLVSGSIGFPVRFSHEAFDAEPA